MSTFKARGLWLFFGLFLPGVVHAVVHGKDDRRNFFEEPHALLRSYAGSVAFSIHSHLRDESGSIAGQFMGSDPFGISSPVRNEWNLCSGEKFADEFTVGAGGCTGFLVAPDLLLTAGHCFRESWETEAEAQETTVRRKCQGGKMLWVFDAYAASPSELHFTPNGEDRAFAGRTSKSYFDEVSVYGCRQVLYISPVGTAAESLGTDFEDYALVQLSQPTSGRRIFQVTDVAPELGTPLGTLGFPQHLMMKFTSQGKATDLSPSRHFLSNLDVFVGNSGSPVLNLTTGEVVGMNVGATRIGPDDERKWNEKRSCNALPSLPETPGKAVILRSSVFRERIPRR